MVWNTERDGTGKAYEDESSFKMPSHDITLYAQWEKVSCKNYKVTFVAGKYGSLEGETEFSNIQHGTKWSDAVEVPVAIPNHGYKFVGWKPELPSEDVEITEDAIYTAIFEKVSKGHTVIFKADKNGWLEGKTEFKNIQHGTSWDEAVDVPKPKAKKGYMFDYWKPSFPDKVKKDGIYTAIFVKCHTIKFEAGKNGWLEGETVFRNIRHETPWSDAVKVPKPKANKGYVFVGWSPVLPSENDKVIKDATYK
ncbi:MAG: hypothetical protein GX076_06850 [Clostridiales bacterium]|nr:hypothetical protein [Clostridiales bacterium]